MSARMVWVYCGTALMGIVPLYPKQSVEAAVRREQQFRGCDNFAIVDANYAVQSRGQLPAVI